MRKKIIVSILTLLSATLLLTGCPSDSSANSGAKTWERDCDWWGNREKCTLYLCQYLDGFNRDGSFKYGYEYLHFSFSCYLDAKSSGRWINIEECD